MIPGDGREGRVVRYWLPLAGWMALIYVLSDQPNLPKMPGLFLDFLLKKGLHAAEYAVLAGLWRRALAAGGVRRAGAWALLLTVAYAATDEWHQSFVPGRHARLSDVAVDAAGASLALAWLELGGTKWLAGRVNQNTDG